MNSATTPPAHARFTATLHPRLSTLPAAPDVIVIGAGAAGIAAARALVASGLTVAVLEARARVGGRAVTTALRGHPIDLGAHWLHAGPVNPLVALGRERGEPMSKAPQESHLLVGRRPARAREKTAFARAFARADRDMTRAAGTPGADRPVSAVPLPGLGPWRDRIARVHALVSGLPLDRVSLQDWPSLEYGDNHFIRGGYGAYLARLAHDLPIRLSMPVTGLDWSGSGVRVETADGGRFTARAAIVTLPVTVLRHSVRFTPALPEPTRAAIDGFLPGLYEHVVLHWPSAPFAGRDRLASMVGGRDAPPGLLTRIDGTPFHYLEFDAAFAGTVDRLGRGDAARRLARAALTEHVGGGRLRDLAMPAVTEWRHDPWSRGSWAVVPPGHAPARAALQAPVGERIWFAGEALSHVQWGTVGGAYEQGMQAARAVTERLLSRSAA